MDNLTVTIKGADYTVIGGDFWDMLAKVKAIPGRKYIQRKWELPCEIAEAESFLQPFQIVNEDSLLDAEIADIQRVQTRLLTLSSGIEESSNRD